MVYNNRSIANRLPKQFALLQKRKGAYLRVSGHVGDVVNLRGHRKINLKCKKDMSYDVQLFRKETKVKEQKLKSENFFDNENNLEPFTELQIQQLKERLLKYDYEFVEENKYGLNFVHSEYGNALLTGKGLYFSTSFDTDCIFEVGMTVSEFTDTGEFAKYDPQNDGWEEF